MTANTVIVLADDDPVMRELASAKLLEAGYAVHVANDGREALNIVKHERVSLVISDLDMPVMDGFQLTNAIRGDEAICDVPVMVITASDQCDAVDSAFAAGATSFLAKPMNWPLFIHAVKFVLRASDDRRALQTARDQAEAGAKFKDSLMSVMSHELRTPLNAIIGFGQIISQQFEKQEDNLHREYAEYIIDSGRRLLSSVSDMLLACDARSGPVAINEVDVSLTAIVSEAISGIEKTLELANVKPEIKLGDHEIEVTCDRALIAKAVRKLIENAVKFSPKGVRVLVGAGLTKSGDLAIVIKDSGPGITPDKLSEVSAPFAQLDMSNRRSREGLGLGLPLVKAIAAAHDGAFRLDSAINEGTHAIITLPAARIRPASDRSPSEPSSRRSALGASA